MTTRRAAVRASQTKTTAYNTTTLHFLSTCLMCTTMAEVVRTFPIPGSLQELERAPYNFIPYPTHFDDVDEVARAESFAELVRQIEVGNRTLNSANMTLFVTEDEDEEPWLEQSRIQALYTLVR
jgi:hypothetical protein